MEVTREQARRPDAVTAELKKGFEWTTKHSQLVSVVLGGALLIGLIWAGWGLWSDHRESGLQEKYYAAEKTYLDKKEKFDLYDRTSQMPTDPKTKQAPKVEGEKPTGDLSQDYGPAVKDLESLVQEAPSSKAAALAALTLAKIYNSYQKHTEALEVLRKAQGAPGLLGVLTRAQVGHQLAENGDCKAAVDQWTALLKNSQARFMAAQLHLNIGLCSENLGQKPQAIEAYKQAAADAKESAAGKSAEKYLKLLEGSQTNQ